MKNINANVANLALLSERIPVMVRKKIISKN
jgi:hypothetical protein